jgi:hypothetical protein
MLWWLAHQPMCLNQRSASSQLDVALIPLHFRGERHFVMLSIQHRTPQDVSTHKNTATDGVVHQKPCHATRILVYFRRHFAPVLPPPSPINRHLRGQHPYT